MFKHFPVAGTTPAQVVPSNHTLRSSLLCMFMASQIGQTPRCCGRATHPQQDLPWSLPSSRSLSVPRCVPSCTHCPFSSRVFFSEGELRHGKHKSFTETHKSHVGTRWTVTRDAQGTVCCAPGRLWEVPGARTRGAILQWTGRHEYAQVAPTESPPCLNLGGPGPSTWPLHFRPFTAQLNPPSSSPHCPLHVYNTFPIGQLFCFNKLLHMKNLEQGLQLMCSAIPSPRPLFSVTWMP